DRPLDPGSLTNLSKRVTIIRGKYVSAGDRFESLRPGYQAVQDQLVAPRYDVPVLSTLLTSDRRSLLLLTPALSAAENYAITLPRFNRTIDPSPRPSPLRGEREKTALPQHDAIDLAADLAGVEAHWVGTSSNADWKG